jgi:hypothetical protein
LSAIRVLASMVAGEICRSAKDNPPKNYDHHQHNETSTSDHRSALRLTYGDDCIRRLEHSSLRARLSTELKFLTHQTAAHSQAAVAILEQPSIQLASTTEPSERFPLEWIQRS